MMQRILVTGGAGFMGSACVERLLRCQPDWQVFVIDALTYAGNLANFSPEVWRSRQFYFRHDDIRNERAINELVAQADAVVHFAAETHVDNSIYNTDDFIDTDVKGTQVLLDAVKKYAVERFIHISTSEVYGTAEAEQMTEEHPLKPRSPYASAKCGADRLVYSYVATFGIPAVIFRPFNNYGPRQHTEKLIPQIITSAELNQPVLLHGDGESSRDWLYVEDTARAVEAALTRPFAPLAGEVINLGTGTATDILTIAKRILRRMRRPESLIQFVPDRPGQVNRHCAAIRKAGTLLEWTPQVELEDGLDRTVAWYLAHPDWWRQLKQFDRAARPKSVFEGK